MEEGIISYAALDAAKAPSCTATSRPAPAPICLRWLPLSPSSQKAQAARDATAVLFTIRSFASANDQTSARPLPGSLAGEVVGTGPAGHSFRIRTPGHHGEGLLKLVLGELSEPATHYLQDFQTSLALSVPLIL